MRSDVTIQSMTEQLRSDMRRAVRRRAGASLFRRIVGWCKPLRAADGDRVAGQGAEGRADGPPRRERASPRAAVRASVTVEASIALPLYLFFFINILTAFDILRLQDDLTAALHQTGNQIAVQAFELRYGAEMLGGASGEGGAGGMSGTDVGTAILSTAYAEAAVRKYLGAGYLEHSPASGGVSLLQSQIMRRADEIDLVASYRVKPYFPGIVGFPEFAKEARYFGHAWTGYEPGGAGAAIGTQDDPVVYVTENGTVYHRNLNCRYLKPAVHQVSVAQAIGSTNNSGDKYTPCEICGGYTNGRGTAYISEGGARIHSTVNCPGLKRTIYYVHLSEVGGQPPCSVCGR